MTSLFNFISTNYRRHLWCDLEAGSAGFGAFSWRGMTKEVSFGSSELEEHCRQWSLEWPNVSIKSFTTLSLAEREMLRNYISEEAPGRSEAAAFIAGMQAVGGKK